MKNIIKVLSMFLVISVMLSNTIELKALHSLKNEYIQNYYFEEIHILKEFYAQNELYIVKITNKQGLNVSNQFYHDTLLFYEIGDFDRIIDYLEMNEMAITAIIKNPISTYADFEDIHVYHNKNKSVTFSYINARDATITYPGTATFYLNGRCRWEANTGRIVSCPAADSMMGVLIKGKFGDATVSYEDVSLDIDGNDIHFYWEASFEEEAFDSSTPDSSIWYATASTKVYTEEIDWLDMNY